MVNRNPTEKTLDKALRLFDKIPDSVKAMYRLRFDTDSEYPFIAVNTPSFINIQIYPELELETNDTTITLRNRKINVSLWRKNKIMHITVYSHRN